MPIYPGRRPRTHRVTVFAHGKQHEWIVEGTVRDARQFEAAKRVELQAQPVATTRATPTFFLFCRDQYGPHAALHLGADTWNKVRRYQVTTLGKHFGPIRLDALTTDHVEAYKRRRLAEVTKRGPVKGTLMRSSSVNNELRVLKTILRWAREEKRLPVPTLKFKMLPRAAQRVKCWTREDVARIFEAAEVESPETIPLLHFLLETGCRKGEALAAEWTWIDWRAGMLRIPVTDYWRPKDAEARDVPLSDGLLSVLRSLPRRSEQFIFPNTLGVRYKTFPEKTYRRITKAAKVSGGPHTTRHTYASHFLQSTPDLRLLAEVLGHSTTYVTELYTHMLPGHLARARNAVQLAPPRKVWRPTLAKAKAPQKQRKTSSRH